MNDNGGREVILQEAIAVTGNAGVIAKPSFRLEPVGSLDYIGSVKRL